MFGTYAAWGAEAFCGVWYLTDEKSLEVVPACVAAARAAQGAPRTLLKGAGDVDRSPDGMADPPVPVLAGAVVTPRADSDPDGAGAGAAAADDELRLALVPRRSMS